MFPEDISPRVIDCCVTNNSKTQQLQTVTTWNSVGKEPELVWLSPWSEVTVSVTAATISRLNEGNIFFFFLYHTKEGNIFLLVHSLGC